MPALFHVIKVASHLMPRLVLKGFKPRFGGPANVHAVPAPVVERAARWSVDWARHITLEDDPFLLHVDRRDRDGGKQRFGIGMLRLPTQPLRFRHLHHLPQIHHHDRIAHVLNDAEIVGNEYIGEMKFLLYVFHEVEHLSLDRDIERGNGLVANHYLGIDAEGTGDADALALPPRELVGIAIHIIRFQVHHLQLPSDYFLPIVRRTESIEPQRFIEGIDDLLHRIER